MNKTFLFDYDKENDSLYIYQKGAKVKGSMDIGNILIDVSVDEKVVGLEILDISKMLKNLNVKKPKIFLEGIEKASIRAEYKPDAIIVYYVIYSEMKIQEPVTSSIAVPITIQK